MRKKTCYFFLTEEYADWEIALVMAGLHSFGDVEVLTFALTKDPVSSMGNLAVLPDLALDEVDPNDVDLLVLPGSPLWEQGANLELTDLVRSVYLLDKGIAAISGATYFLAREGYIDNYLHYNSDEVVRDGQIITAGGVYGFQFAAQVFDFLGFTGGDTFQEWLEYVRRGEEMIRRSRAMLI
jgi:putative intracellular protease/amidase